MMTITLHRGVVVQELAWEERRDHWLGLREAMRERLGRSST